MPPAIPVARRSTDTKKAPRKATFVSTLLLKLPAKVGLPPVQPGAAPLFLAVIPGAASGELEHSPPQTSMVGSAWRGAFLWFSAPAAKVAAGLHGNPIEGVKEA
jgi:hypothetical protein